jgi:hypothetical protein
MMISIRPQTEEKRLGELFIGRVDLFTCKNEIPVASIVRPKAKFIV